MSLFFFFFTYHCMSALQWMYLYTHCLPSASLFCVTALGFWRNWTKNHWYQILKWLTEFHSIMSASGSCYYCTCAHSLSHFHCLLGHLNRTQSSLSLLVPPGPRSNKSYCLLWTRPIKFSSLSLVEVSAAFLWFSLQIRTFEPASSSERLKFN